MDIMSVMAVAVADVSLSIDNAILVGAVIAAAPANKRWLIAAVALVLAMTARITCTAALGWLLQYDAVSLVGGGVVGYMAYNYISGLLKDEENEGEVVKTSQTFWGAVSLIVWDDLSNSLDNMAAASGAAGGDLAAIVIGLMISMSLLGVAAVAASWLLQRAKWVAWIGACALVFVAARMLYIGASGVLQFF